MKPRKQTILIMLIGLLLFAFAAVMAQTPAQGDQKKKTEAGCAMESCCGSDGSCSMKKEGETTTDGAEAKDGCCGESCDMAKHDGKMKHDSKDHKEACCAESCDMSKHDAKHDKKDHKDCCKMKQKEKKKAA